MFLLKKYTRMWNKKKKMNFRPDLQKSVLRNSKNFFIGREEMCKLGFWEIGGDDMSHIELL